MSKPRYSKEFQLFGILLALSLWLLPECHASYPENEEQEEKVKVFNILTDSNLPKIRDPALKIELVVEGLDSPTTMAFLGPNDILVLEKNRGTVQRVVNGQALKEPLLDVNVANKHERGMLGIAVVNSLIDNKSNPINSNNSNIFLYFIGGQMRDGEDRQDAEVDDPKTFRNSLYRYELIPNHYKLKNPQLLLDMPTSARSFHNGGNLLAGPNNTIYVLTGDLTEPYKTQAQNMKNGTSADGSGGILRITQDGGLVGGPDGGILGNSHPLDKYYAYGIRNGFGMDFDPVSGKLWDTENGPFYGDEINIVEPGFNSGWSKVQGIWQPTDELKAGESKLNLDTLVDFNGKGKYSSPEFIWKYPVGSTAIKFLNSDKLGEGYKNDLFVGDINNGYLYHFELNRNRTSLDLPDGLADKIASSPKQLESITLAQFFGGITDLKVGPDDGYLYVVSHGQGKIFRIVPSADFKAATISAEYGSN